MRMLLTSTAAMMLTACASAGEPGIEVRTVRVPVETQVPCPAMRPDRPGPLAELPTDAVEALGIVAAKLAEYSGPGKYADRAELFFDLCAAD